nr:MAG TPA: hypothetical protein [Caudoviricetes sp.]
MQYFSITIQRKTKITNAIITLLSIKAIYYVISLFW